MGRSGLWGGLALICLTACGGPPVAPPAETGAPQETAALQPGHLEMRRWQDPRQRVVIDRGGLAVGPVGGPLLRKLFVEPERLDDLLFFLRTYAPFRWRSDLGALAFGGQGSVRAGEVEKRMIFEWARKVTAEAEAGQSQDSYGLILAWQRGGVPGSCDGLAVYLDGEVRASSCAWPDESRGRLRPDILARLMRGYDAWKPFQQASGGEAGLGRVPARLTFAGGGARDPSPQEIAELQSLASALYRELAGRRPGSTPPPPAAPGHAGPEDAPETGKGPSLRPEAGLLVPPAPPAPLPPPRAVLPDYVPPPSPAESGP